MNNLKICLMTIITWCVIVFAIVQCSASHAATAKTYVKLCTDDNYKTFRKLDPLDTGRYYPTTLITTNTKACPVVVPPPAVCPTGQTGSPPNCVTPPPATCPAGQTGTPPNCVTPPPVLVPPVTGVVCPAGMPCVDMSKLPPVSAGYSDLRLKATTEQPTNSPDDHGAVRVMCDAAKYAREDAILYPGQTDVGHLHIFVGNTGINPNSTTESLRTTGNSTCRGGIMNRTAYWAPAMIDTASNAAIQLRNAQLYYKHGQAEPIPTGLRMIAGGSMATVTDPGTSKQWFECNEQYTSRSSSIPACAKGGLVTQQITFPECWNGKDLDSADHRSHMAYSNNGVCPATHPRKLVTHSEFYYWPVTTNGTSTWKLSSDMYTQAGKQGWSNHADFMMGWNTELHNIVVNRCVNTGKDCHTHLTGDGREFY